MLLGLRWVICLFQGHEWFHPLIEAGVVDQFDPPSGVL